MAHLISNEGQIQIYEICKRINNWTEKFTHSWKFCFCHPNLNAIKLFKSYDYGTKRLFSIDMIISEDTRKYQPANKRRDPDHVFLRSEILMNFLKLIFDFSDLGVATCGDLTSGLIIIYPSYHRRYPIMIIWYIWPIQCWYMNT